MIQIALRGSLRVTLVGVTLGLICGIAVSRFLGSMVFGVATLDPITLLAVPIFFVAVAALAGLAPARRAAKLDPVIALRTE